MSKKMYLIAALSILLVVLLSGCQTEPDIDADISFSAETNATWFECE